MTDEERQAAISMVAANPLVGDLIVGSGGCRKVRFARRGKGKSGGYRIVTYYAGDDMPVFLLAVLYKGSRANFSDGEINLMAEVSRALVAHYRRVAG